MTVAALDSLAAADGASTSVGEAFRRVAGSLRAAGIATAELDARLLVCASCGLSLEAFVARPERAMTQEERDRLHMLAARRAQREPVSRILGKREFWSRDFLIGPATLDPRADTETLVAAALALAVEVAPAQAPISVLDLGTGSGCVLLAILSELPQARGVGLDISPDALHIARRNAAALGVEDRASFVASDWTQAIAARFDLVVANPPYVATEAIGRLAPEVARFDPPVALDGGGDGLDAYRRIVPALRGVVHRGGAAVLEVGAGQAAAVTGMLMGAGFPAVRPWADLAGTTRCLSVRAG